MAAKLNWPVPAEWLALGGKWTAQISDSNADFFTRNQMVVIVEHRFPPMSGMRAYHYASWLPVSTQFVDHFGNDRYFNQILFRAMDRHFRPWLYPKPIPFPAFDLFPRWTRFMRWVRRA